MDLGDIGCEDEDWIYLAQNTDGRHISLKTAMNRCVA
jgi:hypothetical protein